MMGFMSWLLGAKPAVPRTTIVFFVRLSDEDWSMENGAWRCSALQIPGAEVKELRHRGTVLPNERYRVDALANQIVWIGSSPPESVSARIELCQALQTVATGAAEKEQSTIRVAKIGAIATLGGALISAFGTYVKTSNAAGTPVAAAAPAIQSQTPRPEPIAPTSPSAAVLPASEHYVQVIRAQCGASQQFMNQLTDQGFSNAVRRVFTDNPPCGIFVGPYSREEAERVRLKIKQTDPKWSDAIVVDRLLGFAKT
jgi:hypothetical protein